MGIRIFTQHNREGLASECTIEMFMPMFYIELEHLVFTWDFWFNLLRRVGLQHLSPQPGKHHLKIGGGKSLLEV